MVLGDSALIGDDPALIVVDEVALSELISDIGLVHPVPAVLWLLDNHDHLLFPGSLALVEEVVITGDGGVVPLESIKGRVLLVIDLLVVVVVEGGGLLVLQLLGDLLHEHPVLLEHALEGVNHLLAHALGGAVVAEYVA